MMASILFSTIGQAVGGPLGAAVGVAVGGTLDGAIFGRGKGSGGDFLVQRSAYGEVLPRLYGVSRQAGVLIWALPLAKSGGGKGGNRPAYTSSFAIALSSRPIARVGRIWADGREIRNAAGEFETLTQFRVHDGRGGQGADPAIVAAEGLARAPAYAGIGYVVFEDFSLAAFGNRLPNLSFEVFADDLAMAAGDWLADLAAEAFVSVDPRDGCDLVQGFAAAEPRWAGDIETLARYSDVAECYRDGFLAFSRNGRLHDVADADLCAPAGGAGEAFARRTLAIGERPAGAILRYLDPERDYQAGSQRVVRGRSGGFLEGQAAFTATAGKARGLADRMLRRAEAMASHLEIALSWRWLGIAVGDRLRVGGRAEQWRVVRREIEGLLVRLTCEATPTTNVSGYNLGERPAAGGRALLAPVVVAGATSLDVFELPMAVEGMGGAGVWLAATGGVGWRGAQVGLAYGDGAWSVVGDASAPVSRGVLTAELAPGSSLLWDEKAAVEMTMARDDDWFQSRPGLAVLAGENKVRIGGEIVQYRLAEALGGRRFRLRGLLRGRMATGGGGGAHPVGTIVEQFDSQRLLFQPVGPDQIGRQIHARALGPGDAQGFSGTSLTFAGAGAAPLAPCHVRAERRADGTIQVRWIARDRRNFDWSTAAPDGQATVLCRFLADRAGQPAMAMRRGSGGSLTYGLAEQIADFGAPLEDFAVVALSEGDGPEWIRSAAPVLVGTA